MALIDIDDADLLTKVLEQADVVGDPISRGPEPTRRPQAEERTWTLPGVCGSTRVTTSFGHVPAHLVRVGDTLRVRDGSYLRVRRISEFKFDEEFLSQHPEAAPVTLRRNSLGPHVPLQDVAVSPAQDVSISQKRYENRTLPAERITNVRGGVDSATGVLVYFQFHLAKPAQIHCDGVWVAAATD